MRIAKVRLWRRWKVSLVAGTVAGIAVIAAARLIAAGPQGAWLGVGFAISSVVVGAGFANGEFGVGARIAARQRERHGAFILRGAGLRWLRFDGEFAVFGGAGYRARLRFTDLADVSIDATRGIVRGSLRAVDGIDRALEWRLSGSRYRPLERIEALERLAAELAVWREATVTDRPWIAPPLTMPAWFGPAGIAIGVLAIAFAIPLPGAKPHAPDLLWFLLMLAMWQLAPKREELRKAGWTFDDERGKRRARTYGKELG